MKESQQTVLITGANSGIGHALSMLMLENRYNVIGTSRTGIIAHINDPNFVAIPLELTSTASIENAYTILKNKFKNIDILINNAGIAPDISTSTPSMETLKETFDTNVFGTVAFTESILELINREGQIFNISSQMGVLERPAASNSTAYRMSKTALNMYTRTLAARMESRNVAVVSIHPGWVQTKLASKGAPLTTEQSAAGILQLLEARKKSGSFWAADSQEELPW